MPPVEKPPRLSLRSLGNALLLVAVAVPGVLFVRFAYTRCAEPVSEPLCTFTLEHPLLLLNVVFFANVTLLFWLLSLAQRSTWLIDPYWTILPPLTFWFFAAHPAAAADGTRSAVVLALVLLWSVRLTHSYLRREEWRIGWREDWRFAEMRARDPRFWWTSFFTAFLSQQLMLVGLVLPIHAVHRSRAPFGWLDVVATVLCVAGIAVAHAADTGLRRFMVENERRAARGEPKILVLDRGIFRWSRHPNYFGEQLFWWSLALFGVATGRPWTAAGALLNTLVLARVTVMTERRMLARPERAAEYEAYRRRTSVWLPWPPRRQ